MGCTAKFYLLLIFFVETSQNVAKVITWKRTTSSRSSSSRNPLTTAPKDDNDDSRSDFVEEFCMIAGSHSSTLDRLYAWERKLYDEVKVIVRAYLDHNISSFCYIYFMSCCLSTFSDRSLCSNKDRIGLFTRFLVMILVGAGRLHTVGVCPTSHV